MDRRSNIELNAVDGSATGLDRSERIAPGNGNPQQPVRGATIYSGALPGYEYRPFRILHIRQSTSPDDTDHRKRRAIGTTSEASILHLMQPSPWPGYDEAAGTEGVQWLFRIGARLALIGKRPLEAAFLSVIPRQKPKHRQVRRSPLSAPDAPQQSTPNAGCSTAAASPPTRSLGRPYRRRRLTLTPSERNFERALDSRAVIDQAKGAKGVLMAVHGVDADGAFAMLVETSQRSNTKVRVVAEELLASVRTPRDDEAPRTRRW